MKILRRYLLRQHLSAFVFALAALTSFELLRQIARKLGDLLGKGLPWTVIVEFFALTIPFLIAITVSMSVLVAVLYTVSRMAGDHELTALRAGGVSLGQLLRPLLAAATAVAILSFLFNDQILPRTNHRLRSLMTDIYRTKPTFSLKEHVINEVEKGHTLLRAAQIDQSTYRMRDVSVYSLKEAKRIVYADSGRLAFAPNQSDLRLTLFDGFIHEFDRDDPQMFQQTAFRRQLVLMRGVGSEFVRRESDDYRGDREMGICQLDLVVRTAQLERQHAEQQAATAQINGLRALVNLGPLPGDSTASLRRPTAYCRVLAGIGSLFGVTRLEAQQRPLDSLQRDLARNLNAPGREVLATGMLPRARSNEVRALRERAHSARVRAAVYEVELQKKYAIPAACIVFVLVGVPIALRFPRGGMGLVLGAGLIVFSVYYVGLIAGETLANRLVIPSFLAMWTSNILMTVVGLVGLWWSRLAGTSPRLAWPRRRPRRSVSRIAA